MSKGSGSFVPQRVCWRDVTPRPKVGKSRDFKDQTRNKFMAFVGEGASAIN